jgi:hypothetical protein
MPDNDFLRKFHEYVKISVEPPTQEGQGGIYPQPAWIENRDGGVDVMAMAINPEQIWWAFLTHALIKKRETMHRGIVGFDRWTRPDQGTTRGSVYTCVYMEKTDTGLFLPDQIHIGVIEYDTKPTIIVNPWDWDNKFWTHRMLGELHHFTKKLVSACADEAARRAILH